MTPLKQISVVGDVQRRPNLVAELIEALGAAIVNIETLDSQEHEGTVVAVLTVDRYDDAVRALSLAGFNAVGEDALLVRLEDRPGALARLAERFHRAEIPLHSVRIIRRDGGWGIVALSTPRTGEALALVSDVLIS